MDADGLPLIGPSVDYRKVEPINQKKTISFLNHFIMHTSGFLNRFSNVCEEKLSHLTVRLQRLETQMTLLEGKLSSIPGLDQVHVTSSSVQPQTGDTHQTSAIATTLPVNNTQQQPAATQPTTNEPVPMDTKDAEIEKPQQTVSQDPRYAKYFKMLSVGVPEMAVKQKMAVEGLDPNLLSTPDAAMPSSANPVQSHNEDNSASDFSDEEEKSDDSSIEFSD